MRSGVDFLQRRNPPSIGVVCSARGTTSESPELDTVRQLDETTLLDFSVQL